MLMMLLLMMTMIPNDFAIVGMGWKPPVSSFCCCCWPKDSTAFRSSSSVWVSCMCWCHLWQQILESIWPLGFLLAARVPKLDFHEHSFSGNKNINICIYICIYVYIIYMYALHTPLSLSLYIHIYIYIYITCMYNHVYLHPYISTSICTYIPQTRMCVYMYVIYARNVQSYHSNPW